MTPPQLPPLTDTIYSADDPHPECTHQWRAFGVSITTYEPSIVHQACYECRTFRSRSAYYDGPTGGRRPWAYHTEWPHGTWQWPETEAQV